MLRYLNYKIYKYLPENHLSHLLKIHFKFLKPSSVLKNRRVLMTNVGNNLSQCVDDFGTDASGR